MQTYHVFWKLHSLKSKTIIVERIKHDILPVSKSDAWYQTYVHIKACLATGYTGRACSQDQIAPGKVNSGDQDYQGRNIGPFSLHL